MSPEAIVARLRADWRAAKNDADSSGDIDSLVAALEALYRLDDADATP